MTDERKEHSDQDAASVAGQEPPTTSGESKVPTWAWIVGGIAVVLLLAGLYATQTEQGRAWMLGLRSMVTVPLVIGQAQADAQITLEAAGLRLGQVAQEPTLEVAPGTVLSQTPSQGTAVKEDSAVDVIVAAIPSVKVADVVGEMQSNANTILAEQGLRAGTIEYVYDADIQAGDVTAQQPASGESAAVGSAVDLTVSKGVKQGQVPNVVGLSQDDANSVITAAGFKVTIVKATSTSVPAGDVAAQSPAAGVVTTAGSTVTITVSTGAPAAPPAQAPSDPATTPATPDVPAAPDKPSPPVAEKVSVPDVIGKSVLEAVRALRGANLKISFAFAPSEDSFLKIIKQDPASGASVDPGTTVTITIGLPSISLPDGKPTQPMPMPAPQPVQLPATATVSPSVVATP